MLFIILTQEKPKLGRGGGARRNENDADVVSAMFLRPVRFLLVSVFWRHSLVLVICGRPWFLRQVGGERNIGSPLGERRSIKSVLRGLFLGKVPVSIFDS